MLPTCLRHFHHRWPLRSIASPNSNNSRDLIVTPEKWDRVNSRASGGRQLKFKKLRELEAVAEEPVDADDEEINLAKKRIVSRLGRRGVC